MSYIVISLIITISMGWGNRHIVSKKMQVKTKIVSEIILNIDIVVVVALKVESA